MKSFVGSLGSAVVVAALFGATPERCTMAEKMVLTPAGPRPASQVHAVAPGHTLDASGGRLRELDASGKVVKDYGPDPNGTASPEATPPDEGHAPSDK